MNMFCCGGEVGDVGCWKGLFYVGWSACYCKGNGNIVLSACR